jgi:hypothetical protein
MWCGGRQIRRVYILYLYTIQCKKFIELIERPKKQTTTAGSSTVYCVLLSPNPIPVCKPEKIMPSQWKWLFGVVLVFAGYAKLFIQIQ